jgi:hypothetical protein
MKILSILSLFLAFLAINCHAVPVITKQPSPLTNSVSLGAFLTNSITAMTTNPPLSYQWQLNNIPLPSATNASLVLTNIQTTNAGSYVVTVTDGDGSISSGPWVVDVDPTFTKITSDPVVGTYVGQGEGNAAWGDFNNDGNLDLFVSVIQGPNLLFTNNGNGTFTRITTGSLSTGSYVSAGSAWGDYDNDGFPDLFISVNGSPPNNDLLYHNNGNGTFTQITTGAIVSSGGKGNACAWGDYDNDGYLDLYVINSDQNNFLFHNNGNGTFTRITSGPLVTATGNSQGCAWGDYDNDGYLDLFVTRSGNNLLLHNNRNGTFTLITNGPVVAFSSGGPCAWGDYDNDGYLDLFATGGGPNSTSLLYHNNGDGTFTRITNGPVANDIIGYNGGCAWADYDNDGFLDLFISVIGNQNLFYHNNGDGTFSKVITGSVVTDGNAIGCAWGDYDNNGFPDLFTGGAGVPGHLYRNNGNTNNWLTVQCLGRVSNRSGIGAKVRIKATIHGQTMWQLREISGGGGLGSQNDLRCGFGLGDATNVDVVRIEWPSGIVQEFTNVAAKQLLTVKEPSKLGVDFSPTNGEFRLTLTGGRGLVYSVDNSPDLVNWSPFLLLTNQTGKVVWTNQLPELPPALFFRSQEQ